MYRSKVCVQESWYFVTNSCLALIFNLSNPKTTIVHSKKRLQVAQLFKLCTVFFFRLTKHHGSVVKASRSEFGGSSSILTGILKFSAAPRPLYVLLYCCALYNFFFLDFVSGDAGLAHGRDYSDCRASELNSKSAWLSFFLKLSKILEKRRPHYRVFQPSTPRLVRQSSVFWDNETFHTAAKSLSPDSAKWRVMT